MSKEVVTLEQARNVIDRVSKELGLIVGDTTGFVKVTHPTNKHRVYVQKSQKLNRIDTTVPLATDDPMYKALTAHNGAVHCHVLPSLENLEKVLRMMDDPELPTQVSNKPRPFAVTKAPAPRKPKPVEAPVDETRLQEVTLVDGMTLENRLKAIRQSARNAKIRRYMENDGLSEEEAIAVVDGKLRRDEALEAAQNSSAAELAELVAETGIEVVA